MHRDNVRDVHMLKGGLEAVIEVAGNLGAFFVGRTVQESVSDRLKLAAEAPGTLVIYCESSDVKRDEAFAILRVNELLSKRGCRPLFNIQRDMDKAVIHDEVPLKGFVYIKSHWHKRMAPEDASFSSSLAVAEASLAADKVLSEKLATFDAAFALKMAEVHEVLIKQLAECSLLSPSAKFAEERISRPFKNAMRSLIKFVDDSSPISDAKYWAEKITPLILFKSESLEKLKVLLKDDAAILRKAIDTIKNWV